MLKIQPKTFFVGKKAVFLPSCHSTNDIASEMIQKSNHTDGQVILTDYQTHGRGQFGNQWQSTIAKNILMSIILETGFLELSKSFYLNIFTSLGILEALEHFLPLKENQLSVKWPNDIYIGQKKTSGVLIENQIKGSVFGCSIIGIGINVNQETFDHPNATSLKCVLEENNLDRNKVIEKVLEAIEANYFLLKKGNFELLHEKYIKRLFRLNKKSFFKDKNGIFEGTIVGIDQEGMLKIKKNEETNYYGMKEVEFINK